MAAIALAAPAAGAVFKGSCLVDGEMKVHDKDDPLFAPRLVGGEWKFTFETLSYNCVSDSNKDGIVDVATGLGIGATGWYDNDVCGTGKAFGTVTHVHGGPWKYQVVRDKAFAIEFLGGVGVFKWHDAAKGLSVPKTEAFSLDPEKEWEDDYAAGGVLQLSTDSQNKPEYTLEETFEAIEQGHCRKAFRLTGDVTFDFAT